MLYGHRGRPVGIHFRGPTFESFDGSSVVGMLEASYTVPARGDRLAAAEGRLHQGDGVLAGVDYVQRLETRGGVAPAGACDPASDSTVAVPYQARYVFYAA